MLETIFHPRSLSLRTGWIFLLTITLGLSGCATVNNKVGTALKFETDLKLTFKVDADINQDESKKPSPLFIRLYELKSPKMFNKADFIDLYDRDKEALGADMVAKQALKRLKPGEDAQVRFVLDKETRYVGLYAEFLDYKDSEYKLVFPVVANNVIRTAVKLQVSGNKIEFFDKD